MLDYLKKFYSTPGLFYPALLCIVFAISFSQIIDHKVSIGGDNAKYYLLANSIASGKGYVAVWTPSESPTAIYPPGYPLLMSTVMVFTESVTAQKWLNGLFLLGSALLLFFIVKQLTSRSFLAFAISVLPLVNYHLLKFATMMMSEMSFMFFSLLAVFFLLQSRDDRPPWRDTYFYLFVLTLAFSFHIRTQGISLVLAAFAYFLLTRRWRRLAFTGGGFVLLALPWRIRNRLQDLGSSRYLEELFMANPWRPAQGQIGIPGLIQRIIDQGSMLITKAIPDSLFNLVDVQYRAPASGMEWLYGLAIVAVMIYGFWRLTSFRWLFLGYFAAVFAIVASWSATIDNRYLVTFIPFLQLGFFYGIFELVRRWMERKKRSYDFSRLVPVVILVVGGLMIPKLEPLRAKAQRGYPRPYYNYFQIASQMRQQNLCGPETLVSCRKPTLFYLFSRCYVTKYAFSPDPRKVIQEMINKDVDYVVLDQLGYSSTARYLYPAIKKFGKLFQPVMQRKKPNTYLLRFDADQARKILDKGGSP